MATRAAPPKSPPPPRARARDSVPDPFADPPAQQELTPAPSSAPAVVGDEARKAIATIATQLTEMDVVEAGLQALELKYAKVVYAVDTVQGMADAKAARKVLKDTRVAVEHAREAAKRPVIDLGRNIDGKATAIKTRILKVETPIDQQITAQETKEAERVADLQKKLRELQNTPSLCIGKTAVQLQEVLDAIVATPLDDFAEFKPQAAAAQESTRQQVTLLLNQARQSEEFAALKKAQDDENERKAKLQARVDALGDCLKLPYRTSDRVQQAIQRLTDMPIGDDFAEYAPAAREKKVATIAALVNLRDEKKRAEDAAIAAAAAPAPTPTPTLAPTPAPTAAPRFIMGGMPDADYAPRHGGTVLNTRGPMGMDSAPQAMGTLDDLSDHDRINEEGARRLHAQFVVEDKVGAEHAGHAAQAAGYEFVTGQSVRMEPPDADAVDTVARQRPTDSELLDVIAQHFDVPGHVAEGWLNAFGRSTTSNT